MDNDINVTSSRLKMQQLKKINYSEEQYISIPKPF